MLEKKRLQDLSGEARGSRSICEVKSTGPVQGNLDALALISGERATDEGVNRIPETFESRPHIFNPGHGILPRPHVEHVERLVAGVRAKGNI